MLLNFCSSKPNKKMFSKILETLKLMRTCESQYEHNKISLQQVCEKFNGAKQYVTALIFDQLQSSVPKRIKHWASNMLIYREKNSNLIRSRFFTNLSSYKD